MSAGFFRFYGPEMTKSATSEFVQAQVFESLSGVRLDREKGIVHGVKLLGSESLNGRVYPGPVMERSVQLYEGAKAFIDHQPETSKGGRRYRERFGTHKNARYVEGKGIFADHHFNPKHPSAEQYMWDVENAPESVGFSHTAAIRFAKKPDAQGRKVVEEIGQVLSVDLVAEPATTKGLFESQSTSETEDAEMDLSKITIEELTSARPDLVKALTEKAAATDQIKTLESQLAETRKQLDALAAEKRQAERDALIGEELKAAHLDPANKAHVSDVFLKQLIATEDVAARKELIADRAALVSAAPTTEGQATGGLPEKPVTTTFTAGAFSGGNVAGRLQRIRETKDPKAFAAMYQ